MRITNLRNRAIFYSLFYKIFLHLKETPIDCEIVIILSIIIDNSTIIVTVI